MERQYIGARYVPKFWDNGSGSTDWTPNIPYESMVVVTYMNNSYTSKVPVPATQVTPNIDTEHWALTGAYNAQVEQYRQQTEAVQNSVNEINAVLPAISEKSNRAYKRLKGSKAFLIGDSLNLSGGWGENLIAIENLTAVNVGNGSMGFTSAGITAPYIGLNLLDTLKKATENMTEAEKNTYDYFVAGVGVNDHGSNAETVKTKVTEFFEYVKANFKNARICFFVDHTFSEISANLAQIYDAMITSANNCGVNTTDVLKYACIANINEWKSDGVHMNNVGYKEYAGCISTWLNGGVVNTRKDLTNLLNSVTVPEAAEFTGGSCIIENGIVYYQCSFRLNKEITDHTMIFNMASFAGGPSTGVVPVVLYLSRFTGIAMIAKGIVYAQQTISSGTTVYVNYTYNMFDGT